MRVSSRVNIYHKKESVSISIVLEPRAIDSHPEISRERCLPPMLAFGSKCDNKEENRMDYASCVACRNIYTSITSSNYQNTRILSNQDRVCGCVEIKNAAEVTHVGKAPASYNIALCLFSRRLRSQKIRQPTCMWRWLGKSKKHLKFGMRIKSLFRGFDFFLLRF